MPQQRRGQFSISIGIDRNCYPKYFVNILVLSAESEILIAVKMAELIETEGFVERSLILWRIDSKLRPQTTFGKMQLKTRLVGFGCRHLRGQYDLLLESIPLKRASYVQNFEPKPHKIEPELNSEFEPRPQK